MKPALDIQRYDIIMYNDTPVGVQFFAYSKFLERNTVTFYSSDETPYTFYADEMVRVVG